MEGAWLKEKRKLGQEELRHESDADHKTLQSEYLKEKVWPILEQAMVSTRPLLWSSTLRCRDISTQAVAPQAAGRQRNWDELSRPRVTREAAATGLEAAVLPIQCGISTRSSTAPNFNSMSWEQQQSVLDVLKGEKLFQALERLNAIGAARSNTVLSVQSVSSLFGRMKEQLSQRLVPRDSFRFSQKQLEAAEKGSKTCFLGEDKDRREQILRRCKVLKYASVCERVRESDLVLLLIRTRHLSLTSPLSELVVLAPVEAAEAEHACFFSLTLSPHGFPQDMSAEILENFHPKLESELRKLMLLNRGLDSEGGLVKHKETLAKVLRPCEC